MTGDASRAETAAPDAERARGRRNVAIAVGLLAFAVLIFVVTLVQMQGQILDRPL